MHILFKIINFVILFGGIGFLGRKMIKNMFGGRREKIGQSLVEADEARDQAKNLIRDKEAAVETLKKCTNLKLLLVTYGVLTEQQVEELREALPDARIYLKDSEVDQVWRGDKSFFDMRDAIHMYYIDWNGNEIPVNPYTGEENQYRDTNPFV